MAEGYELDGRELALLERACGVADSRIGTDSERFSGQRGVGPDADAVALGELLDRLEAARCV